MTVSGGVSTPFAVPDGRKNVRRSRSCGQGVAATGDLVGHLGSCEPGERWRVDVRMVRQLVAAVDETLGPVRVLVQPGAHDERRHPDVPPIENIEEL